MSYFMTTIGKRPDLSGIPKVEAVPIEQAQEYLRRLVTDLTEGGDKSDLYFVSDGESGTSHNFVMEIQEQIYTTRSFASTRLDRVIDACAAAGNSFRIWWAHGPQGHLEVKRCDTIDLLKKTIVEQVLNQGPSKIAVAYTPRK